MKFKLFIRFEIFEFLKIIRLNDATVERMANFMVFLSNSKSSFQSCPGGGGEFDNKKSMYRTYWVKLSNTSSDTMPTKNTNL